MQLIINSNFLFNRNISYEIDIIKNIEHQCDKCVNCNCPFNKSYNKSIIYGSYYKIYNGKDYGYNMTVITCCYKDYTSPFTDYNYQCDSESTGLY